MRLHLSRRVGVLFAGTFTFLAFGALIVLFWGAVQPTLAVGQAVTVSATVTKTISCSNSTTTTTFGTLNAASVNTAAPTVSSTMACINDLGGCTLSINDSGGGGNGGLWNSVASHLIPSPNAAYAATTTLAAGTEGFGINATTTVGAGAPLTLNSNYSLSGNSVGKITTSTLTLASTTATTSGAAVIVTDLAAISASTPGGSYTDTITYGCTAN